MNIGDERGRIRKEREKREGILIRIQEKTTVDRTESLETTETSSEKKNKSGLSKEDKVCKEPSRFSPQFKVSFSSYLT